MGPGAKKLNDDAAVPLKWLFAAIGTSVSAFLFSGTMLFYVGHFSAETSLAQTNANTRISTLEAQREQSLEFRRQFFEKIAVLETKVDALREDLKRR